MPLRLMQLAPAQLACAASEPALAANDPAPRASLPGKPMPVSPPHLPDDFGAYAGI